MDEHVVALQRVRRVRPKLGSPLKRHAMIIAEAMPPSARSTVTAHDCSVGAAIGVDV